MLLKIANGGPNGEVTVIAGQPIQHWTDTGLAVHLHWSILMLLLQCSFSVTLVFEISKHILVEFWFRLLHFI